MGIESMRIIYRGEELLLGLSGEKYYLCTGDEYDMQGSCGIIP